MVTTYILLFRCLEERSPIARMLGNGVSRIVPKLPVSYPVFHSVDSGHPFVAAWPPTY